jgi:hypothetical protein
MFVMGERVTNSLSFHNLKAGAICDAPVFIIGALVPVQSGLKLLWRLSYHG